MFVAEEPTANCHGVRQVGVRFRELPPYTEKPPETDPNVGEQGAVRPQRALGDAKRGAVVRFGFIRASGTWKRSIVPVRLRVRRGPSWAGSSRSSSRIDRRILDMVLISFT